MSTRTFGRKILDCLTLGVTSDLPIGKLRKRAYIENLESLRANEEQKYLFEHLYMNLDVLDNKTNSLIQFVSILVALQTATVAYFITKKLQLELVFLIGVGFAYLAGILFLTVEQVRWLSDEDLADDKGHAFRLLKIRDKRTILYRIGWWLTVMSLAILGYSIVNLAKDVQPGLFPF